MKATHIVPPLFRASRTLLRPRARAFFLATVTLVCLLSERSTTFAASGSWNFFPFPSTDWNTGSNWSSSTVPNGSGDTATFDLAFVASVFVSANTQVAGISFTAAAVNPSQSRPTI
jgi:hypothetical protein